MAEARGYSVAFARDMIPEKMKAYSASLPPVYEKYRGRYLAIGGPGRGVDWLAGDWANRLIMIGEFPSRSAVGDFWWSPEYRQSASLRKGAVTVDVIQAGGTGQAPQDRHQSFLLVVVPGGDPWLPDDDLSAEVEATVLVACGPDDLTVLEGAFDGLSVTLVACGERSAVDRLWERAGAGLTSRGARVCAVSRAPAS